MVLRIKMKKIKHPYEKFEESKLWNLIENALNDLIKNQDLELTTRKEYVVGYLCKIIDAELLKNDNQTIR
jgi:hypothetical protein